MPQSASRDKQAGRETDEQTDTLTERERRAHKQTNKQWKEGRQANEAFTPGQPNDKVFDPVVRQRGRKIRWSLSTWPAVGWNTERLGT